jgi:hypothetical protein
MFFTLVSNTLFRKISTPRDYLYIFVVGAVCYSIVHWYLYSKQQEGIMEKVRQYLYYVMAGDVIAAFAIKKFYPSREPKKDAHNEENKQEQSKELTKEQQQEIIQRMMIVRKQQELLQKEKLDKPSEKSSDKPSDKPSEKTSEKTSDKKQETEEDKDETKEPDLPVYKE